MIHQSLRKIRNVVWTFQISPVVAEYWCNISFSKVQEPMDARKPFLGLYFFKITITFFTSNHVTAPYSYCHHPISVVRTCAVTINQSRNTWYMILNLKILEARVITPKEMRIILVTHHPLLHFWCDIKAFGPTPLWC